MGISFPYYFPSLDTWLQSIHARDYRLPKSFAYVSPIVKQTVSLEANYGWKYGYPSPINKPIYRPCPHPNPWRGNFLPSILALNKKRDPSLLQTLLGLLITDPQNLASSLCTSSFSRNPFPCNFFPLDKRDGNKSTRPSVQKPTIAKKIPKTSVFNKYLVEIGFKNSNLN